MSTPYKFKAGIIGIFTALVFLMFGESAQALEYDVTTEFDIALHESMAVSVNQRLIVTNTSPEFLSTTLSIDFPFENVESLKVESGGDLLSANIENKRLWVEFTDNAIDFGETREFMVTYQLPNYVKDLGDVKLFTWPEFILDIKDTIYTTKVNYPSRWEDVLYSSQGVDSNINFDIRRSVAFNNVDKNLTVYIGRYVIKQIDLRINATTFSKFAGDFAIPVNQNFLVNSSAGNVFKDGDKSYYKIPRSNSSVDITIIKRIEPRFNKELTESLFYKGYKKLGEVDERTPINLYRMLLGRFSPDRKISEWQRLDVETITKKPFQNDLDYTNALTALFVNNDIPAHIVYGPAKYPDGTFHWHFWVVYLDKSEGKEVWREVDPFLQDANGDQHFQSVPPDRLIWGTLGTESDLRDIDSNIFLTKPANVHFKYFSTVSAQAGYISSQQNKYVFDQRKSILGEATKRVEDDYIFTIGFASMLIGVGLILYAVYQYRFEKYLHAQNLASNVFDRVT